MVPYEECLVKDYISTYFESNEHKPIEFYQLGGIGVFGILDFLTILSYICTIVETIRIVNQVRISLVNWVEKHLKIGNNCPDFHDLEMTITLKNITH